MAFRVDHSTFFPPHPAVAAPPSFSPSPQQNIATAPLSHRFDTDFSIPAYFWSPVEVRPDHETFHHLLWFGGFLLLGAVVTAWAWKGKMPIPERFLPAVRFRASVNALRNRHRFWDFPTLLGHETQNGTFKLTERAPLCRNNQGHYLLSAPPQNTVYEGQLDTCILREERGAIAVWMGGRGSTNYLCCGRFPVGTAAHRFLSCNPHLWRDKPGVEVAEVIRNAVEINSRSFRAFEKGGWRVTTTPDLVGPNGQGIAFALPWSHGGKYRALLIQEVGGDGICTTSALASSRAYLSMPNPEWSQLSFPWLSLGNQPRIDTLLVRNFSPAGQAMETMGHRWVPTEDPTVHFLPEDVVMAALDQTDSLLRGAVERQVVAPLLQQLNQASDESWLAFASSYDVVRWVLQKIVPLRLNPNHLPMSMHC